MWHSGLSQLQKNADSWIPGAREVLTFQSPSVLPSGSMEATTFSETTTSPVLLSVICEGDTGESEHTCFPLSCQESSTMGGGEAPCLSADGWRGYGSPFCAPDSLPDGSSWEGPGSPWGRRRSCPGLVAGHPRVREKQCVRLLHIQGVPFPSILWSPRASCHNIHPSFCPSALLSGYHLSSFLHLLPHT